jgi:carbon monoxide dehydrogenase subunit G
VVVIENEFDVAATPAEVYELMLDPERVGECIAGAKVTGRRDDGSYDATVTVKLGPVKMTYAGTIAIVESDAVARTATMLAKGSEQRGQGTAQATLLMSVAEREGGGSHVNVSADMLVTGRVAQMGRGVMQDVARRMIAQMAQNMEALLAGGAPAKSEDAISAGSLLGSVVADRTKRIFGSSQGE